MLPRPGRTRNWTRKRRPPRLPEKKRRLQACFDAELVGEIEKLIGAGSADDLDFEALETGVRRRALAVAARMVEKALNADHGDHAGATRPCSCGGQARYAGRREKVLQSSLGKMVLERAYYHCAKCGQGFFPRDSALGMEGTWLSPAVTRMVGAVGSMESYQEGSDLLSELAGLSIDAKQVERTAKSLGREIERDEQEHADPAPGAEIMPTMYLGMDGTGVPMRKEEVEGRHPGPGRRLGHLHRQHRERGDARR